MLIDMIIGGVFSINQVTIDAAWNNAYYLLADMKKDETEHHHY